MISGAVQTREIILIGKRRNYGVESEVGAGELILHPLPVESQHDDNNFWVGQEIAGRYGVMHDTKKLDNAGRKIYVQYFIPSSVDKLGG